MYLKFEGCLHTAKLINQCSKCSRSSVVNGTVTGTKGHVVGEEEESREEEQKEEVGRSVINLPQEGM